MGIFDQFGDVILALRPLDKKYAEAFRDSCLLQQGIRPKSAMEIRAEHEIDLQRMHDLRIVLNRQQGIEFLSKSGYPANFRYFKERLSTIMYKNILRRKEKEVTRLGSEVLFSYGELLYIIGITSLQIPQGLAEILNQTQS